MNTTLRTSVLALGLFAGGIIAGPVINADDGSVATGSLAEAGAPSLFVPIEAYRAIDTRQFDFGRLSADFPGVNEGAGGNIIRFFADLDENGDQAIPAEAIGVTFNVTAIRTEGRGFAVVEPGNTNSGATVSTVNWTSDGQNVANSGSVLLGFNNDSPTGPDTLQIRVEGDPGARADVALDVTGYYLPAP